MSNFKLAIQSCLSLAYHAFVTSKAEDADSGLSRQDIGELHHLVLSKTQARGRRDWCRTRVQEEYPDLTADEAGKFAEKVRKNIERFGKVHQRYLGEIQLTDESFDFENLEWDCGPILPKDNWARTDIYEMPFGISTLARNAGRTDMEEAIEIETSDAVKAHKAAAAVRGIAGKPGLDVYGIKTLVALRESLSTLPELEEESKPESE